MFGWFFRKKEPENYEAVLESLASDIADRRARLADIRQRQRRAAFWLTVYAGSTWVLYVALWYVRLVPRLVQGGPGRLDKVVKGAPVIVGPVLIIFARRIMEAWYTRTGNREEATLKRLAAKQRETIDEIKKKTNYYSTKNLLERYDEPLQGPKTPQNRNLNASPAVPGRMPITPQQQQATASGTPGAPQVVQAGKPNGNLLSPPQRPVAPARRQWYDRLADAVLGEDADAPSGKYALICGKCFTHNGLVKESVWSQTKYTCPRCGFFNDAPGAHSGGEGITSSVSSPERPVNRLSMGSSSMAKGIGPSATMPTLRRSPAAVPIPEQETDESEAEKADEAAVEGDVSRMDVDS